jgi:hypothetical protein
LIYTLLTVSLHHCLILLIDFRLHSLTEWLVKLQQSTHIIFRNVPHVWSSNYFNASIC